LETEVLVTGTFNVVHAGHVRLLEFASKYGKVTVGINADPYLKKKYGENAVPLVDRSYVLKSIKYVDSVVVFMEEDPSALIMQLKPRYYIKGPDYTLESLPELGAIKAVGAHPIMHPTDKEYNSSELSPTLPKSAFENLNKYS
jgi:cytidyltransferase-like protein